MNISEIEKSIKEEMKKGRSLRRLRDYRQFYIQLPDFEIWHSRVPNLSWTHIRQVLPVVNEDARYWYLREASRENWSARTLARNVGSQYYQRLLQSPNKDAVVAEMVKSPVVAEFLNLGQDTDFTESDLEKSIIGQIGKFIMELGRGFCRGDRSLPIAATG